MIGIFQFWHFEIYFYVLKYIISIIMRLCVEFRLCCRFWHRVVMSLVTSVLEDPVASAFGVGNHLYGYTVLQPARSQSKLLPSWKFQISHTYACTLSYIDSPYPIQYIWVISSSVNKYCRWDVRFSRRRVWDIAPCSLSGVDRRFRRAYCVHHQGGVL
jgi:hypothetical protein